MSVQLIASFPTIKNVYYNSQQYNFLRTLFAFVFSDEFTIINEEYSDQEGIKIPVVKYLFKFNNNYIDKYIAYPYCIGVFKQSDEIYCLSVSGQEDDMVIINLSEGEVIPTKSPYYNIPHVLLSVLNDVNDRRGILIDYDNNVFRYVEVVYSESENKVNINEVSNYSFSEYADDPELGRIMFAVRNDNIIYLCACSDRTDCMWGGFYARYKINLDTGEVEQTEEPFKIDNTELMYCDGVVVKLGKGIKYEKYDSEYKLIVNSEEINTQFAFPQLCYNDYVVTCIEDANYVWYHVYKITTEEKTTNYMTSIMNMLFTLFSIIAVLSIISAILKSLSDLFKVKR